MFKAVIILASFFAAQNSFAQSAKAYVALNPAGDFVATMKTVKGTASMLGSKVVAKNVVIDLRSMTTGLDLRDDHAKNKYLDVKNYPEAILLEATGENGKGQGKLKFHGQEGPISGTYKINGKTLSAEFKFNLSAFGIKDISYKGIGVEDEVKVEVELPIVAAAAPVKAPGPVKALNKAAPAPAKPQAKPLKK
jgi:polyisoprenoid-binding protein YceI